MPGDGIIPLDEISSKLKSKGYEGIASIELFRPEYGKWNLKMLLGWVLKSETYL